jgi:hypothetical protein
MHACFAEALGFSSELSGRYLEKRPEGFPFAAQRLGPWFLSLFGGYAF